MIGLTCYWRKADPNPILKLFIDIVRKYKIQGTLRFFEETHKVRCAKSITRDR